MRKSNFHPRVESPMKPMTGWERACFNAGLDPLHEENIKAAIWGPHGYPLAEVETTCKDCGLQMEGQFKWCINCSGKHGAW